MPLDPGTTSGILISNLAAASIVGISAPQLAQAIGDGLSLYANSGMTVTTIDVGTLGVGTGTGTGVIIPTPTLEAAFGSTFPANTIIGVSSTLLISALSIALTEIFAGAIINTLNPTVGVGVGIIKVIPNPAASLSAFSSGFVSAGLVGTHAPLLASAISQGLDTALASATGAIIIAGASSIYPSGGVGTGRIS